MISKALADACVRVETMPVGGESNPASFCMTAEVTVTALPAEGSLSSPDPSPDPSPDTNSVKMFGPRPEAT